MKRVIVMGGGIGGLPIAARLLHDVLRKIIIRPITLYLLS